MSKVQFLSLVGRVPGAKFLGFSEEAAKIVQPQQAWRRIASVDFPALDSIDEKANDSELAVWLGGHLAGKLSSKELFVSVGGFGSLPWGRFEFSNSTDALAMLWLASESRELLLLDSAADWVFGVTCEEYEYEVRFFSVSDG